MDKKHNIFLLFLGWSGGAILLSTFFLTILGVIDLKIFINITLNTNLNNLMKLVLYFVNVLFVYAIVTEYSNLKIFIQALGFMPFYVVLNLLDWFNFNAIFLVFYILIFNKNQWKNTLKRYLILMSVLFGFQIITNTIKFETAINYSMSHNFIEAIIYSIDLLLFYFYCYKITKEVKLYDGSIIRLGLECIIPTKINSIPENAKSSKETLDTSTLNTRQKIIFSLMVIGYQIFQLLVVLAIGVINNTIIELLVMLPVFWVGRKILGVCWHSESLYICSAVTFTGFYILTKITLPFQISLFVTVLLTASFTYMLYFIGCKFQRLEELEKRYETDFTKYGLSTEKAKFAYDYKIKGLSIKEQMLVTGLTDQVVRNYRSDVNRAIKNFNKSQENIAAKISRHKIEP